MIRKILKNAKDLKKHTGQVFEVQIREGFLCDEGQETLGVLRDEYDILQVEEKLDKIITEISSFVKNLDIQASLKVVKNSLLQVFNSTLHVIQIYGRWFGYSSAPGRPHLSFDLQQC